MTSVEHVFMYLFATYTSLVKCVHLLLYVSFLVCFLIVEF